MQGYIFIIPFCILAYSFITTRGAILKNSQRMANFNNRAAKAQKERSSSYKDYYQDDNLPLNYDSDYYPYKSYIDDSDDELCETQHTSEKKHNAKRIISSKEKTLNTKETNIKHFNSQKKPIKTQRKAKTNFKTKSKRYLLQNTNIPVEYRKQEVTYNLPPQISLTSDNPYSNYNVARQNRLLQKNFGSNMVGVGEKQSKIIENGYHKFEALKPSNQITPYDYLHINNRSQKDLNDLTDDNNYYYEYELPASNFDLKSLREIMNEPEEQSNYPQCPVINYSNNDGELGLNNIVGKRFLNPLPSRTEGVGDYFIRNPPQERNEEYKDTVSNKNLRIKRNQKIKTFTLSFPEGRNMGSYISLKDLPMEMQLFKGKSEKSEKFKADKCITTKATECTTIPTCSTTVEICTTKSTICTTTEECNTTTECAKTVQEDILCTDMTTCENNFKELNEGNKFLLGLSNYVSSIVRSNVINNATLSNKKSKKQRLQAINGLNPIKNKYSIIKFEPHSVKTRSNEQVEEELKNNIYIIKLLKDLSSLGKLNEIPLKNQKSYFSVPYAPRIKRHLTLMDRL